MVKVGKGDVDYWATSRSASGLRAPPHYDGLLDFEGSSSRRRQVRECEAAHQMT